MLIVMSDLHLAEASSNSLGNVKFDNNLPASVYRVHFNEIADFVHKNHIAKVELVLAGDIFELTRSELWLENGLRPYIHLNEVTEGSALETRIAAILATIAKEERVTETLEIFRTLSTTLQRPVNMHYLPGNHDRLANATPLIRHQVQQLLGLPINNAPFPNQFIAYSQGEPFVLVRHGHEYDPGNFGLNVKDMERIPTFIPAEIYGQPVLGDITTLKLAAKLPKLFREHYSKSSILANADLLLLYQRLMDFDNVRPASALVKFLLTTPGLSQSEAWDYLEPIFLRAMNDIAENAELSQRILTLGGLAGVSSRTLALLLRRSTWKHGIPFWLVRRTSDALAKSIKLGSIVNLVAKEECLQPGASTMQCIVCGHTHNPEVELLQVEDGQHKYYLNSGTFRNVIATTPGIDKFSRLRSKARVLIFEPGEHNPEYTRETGWSFDFTAKFAYGSEPEVA
jgi:UDP-2,3-diacylglucosamine pyrophosphatase LpxH